MNADKTIYGIQRDAWIEETHFQHGEVIRRRGYAAGRVSEESPPICKLHGPTFEAIGLLLVEMALGQPINALATLLLPLHL